jgi:F-type H+-transporting ATPase subunit a
MEHLLGSGWRWQAAVAGHRVQLDALLATAVAGIAILSLALWAARSVRRPRVSHLATVVRASLDYMDDSVTTGPSWARRRIAALGFTLFWFVLLSHWLHLVPAITLRAPTSDINVTLALAMVTIGVVNVTAAQVTGAGNFARHYLSPPYLLPVRLAEIAIKTLTLSLRLFGVLFASAILVEVVNDVLPPPATVVPLVLWTAFDIVMAVVQAYIFAILAITYYNLAVDTVPRHGPDGDKSAVEPSALVRTRELATIGAGP